MQRDPSKTLAQKSPSRAREWAFQRDTCPSQPAEVSQVVTHLPDEFHLLIQEVFLQEVAEVRVCAGGTQDTQIQKGLVQALLQDHDSFHGVLF